MSAPENVLYTEILVRERDDFFFFISFLGQFVPDGGDLANTLISHFHVLQVETRKHVRTKNNLSVIFQHTDALYVQCAPTKRAYSKR